MRSLLLFCFLACGAALTTTRRTATRTVYTRTVTFPAISTLLNPRGTDFRVKSVYSGLRGGGNALIVDASTTVVPRFVVRFYRSTTASLQAAAVRWSLLKLVEYQEVNNQSGFQIASDNIIANHSLLDPVVVANRRWTAWVKTTPQTHVTRICSSLMPYGSNSTFRVTLCANFCGRRTNQTRTGPGAGCTKPTRSCKPGGPKWSLQIDNFPWTTGDGMALKVLFDTRTVMREITRDGTMLAETDPDPREPVVAAPTTEDENDSVNDMGDDNQAAWERTIDVSGPGCGACATAEVIRDVYAIGESSRDNENVQSTLATFSREDLRVTRTFRVSYLSFVPLVACRPNLLLWDPEIINLNADDAASLIPSLALVSVLVSLFM